MEERLDHSIRTEEVGCAACGKPHGALDVSGVIVLCREKCLPGAVRDGLPEVAPEPKHAGEELERRRATCGQCGRTVGHVSMHDRGPTPAVFHAGACWEAYLEHGRRDPKGERPGR